MTNPIRPLDRHPISEVTRGIYEATIDPKYIVVVHTMRFNRYDVDIEYSWIDARPDKFEINRKHTVQIQGPHWNYERLNVDFLNAWLSP